MSFSDSHIVVNNAYDDGGDESEATAVSSLWPALPKSVVH